MRVITLITDQQGGAISQRSFALGDEGSYPPGLVYQDVRHFLKSESRTQKIPIEQVYSKEEQKKQIKKTIDHLLIQLHDLK